MRKIKRNLMQCKHCKTVLESTATHEFQMCPCGKVGIDGGLEYLRRIGSPQDIVELSIMEEHT